MTRSLRLVLPAFLLLDALVTLQIAALLGAGWTLLLLLLGVAVGIALRRREPPSILKRLRRTSSSGDPVPAEPAGCRMVRFCASIPTVRIASPSPC
jgi:UPF0716 family protein affecting phage T7 exclusion